MECADLSALSKAATSRRTPKLRPASRESGIVTRSPAWGVSSKEHEPPIKIEPATRAWSALTCQRFLKRRLVAALQNHDRRTIILGQNWP
jgi:hypothetical protein